MYLEIFSTVISFHILLFSGAEAINNRLATIRCYFDKLKELAGERHVRLSGGANYYQFFTDADDVDAYLVDTLRLVGSEDVGKDEGTVQLLIKKHDDVSDDLLKFEENIKQLHIQVWFNLKFLCYAVKTNFYTTD